MHAGYSRMLQAAGAADAIASALTARTPARQSPPMSDTTIPWIVSEGLAGLFSQAIGLTEAAGLPHDLRILKPPAPWKWITARLWPNPLAKVAESVQAPFPPLIVGAGGMGGAVLAALRRPPLRVPVQNPRIDPRRYDLVIVNRHDELTGPNVIVIRTALHRVTPARLAAEAERWQDRFTQFRRPLVAVLLGGNNGRYRLDKEVGAKLAADLVGMAQRDRVGIV